jgi:magnesium-transporting ATPase (P-type)
MKKLLFPLTLPLTIISFLIFSKWWYVIAIDAKDVFAYGFPLIYKCEGFHTSMSTQYFLTEMAFNFLCYFAFWLLFIGMINKFWNIQFPKYISKLFWYVCSILFGAFMYLSCEFDDRYLLKRPFEVKLIDCGLTVLEKHSTDREKYLKLKGN